MSILPTANFDPVSLLIFFDLNLLIENKKTGVKSERPKSLPVGFQDKFTLNNRIHSYNNRTSKLFHVPHTRTKLRQFSMEYQGHQFINSLSNGIKERLS